jgi:hypothetical protein
MSGGARRSFVAFTLIELLVVIGVLTLLIAVLLPTLSVARKKAWETKMNAGQGGDNVAQFGGNVRPQPAASPGSPRDASIPAARVKSFEAVVGLTPRLSVGTAEPESIYEARMSAKVKAAHPGKSAWSREKGAGGLCQIDLPLPPQIISLADLSVKVEGQPSGSVAMREGKLTWRGELSGDAAADMELTYTAVGKGLFMLEAQGSPVGAEGMLTPSGMEVGILDKFRLELTTYGSDVRMVELSLQPTEVKRNDSGAGMTYTWDYKNLMFGRPIALDVLGIAPVDRLGELSWLGPLSVIVFGMLVGVVAKAYRVERFDRWMLLLVVGTFTAAYPLMYFAQEYVRLPVAIGVSAGVVLVIIAARVLTAMPWGVGLGGVVLPAGLIMAVTLAGAVRPGMQGLLLTAEAIAFFVMAMVLVPRVRGTGESDGVGSDRVGPIGVIAPQPALG